MCRKVLLVTCAVLIAIPSVARADLVLISNATGGTTTSDVATSDNTTGVTGLGSIPTLLGMSGSGGVAAGITTPNGPPTGGVFTPQSPGTTAQGGSGQNQSPFVLNVSPAVGSGGWTDGSHVGVGVNINVPGSSPGVTLNSLTMTIYTVSTGQAVGTFSTAGPITITRSALDQTPGGGNGTVNFVLSSDEAMDYTTLLQDFGADDLRVGTMAMASGLTGAQNVQIRGFDQTGTEIGIPDQPPSEIALPASLPLFAGGLGCIGLLGWRRKRKSTSSIL